MGDDHYDDDDSERDYAYHQGQPNILWETIWAEPFKSNLLLIRGGLHLNAKESFDFVCKLDVIDEFLKRDLLQLVKKHFAQGWIRDAPHAHEDDKLNLVNQDPHVVEKLACQDKEQDLPDS